MAAPRSGQRPDAQIKGKPAGGRGAYREQVPWSVLASAAAGAGTLPDQVWRVKAARVWLLAAAGWSAGTYELIWASNDETGEEEFFLSDAAADTPVEVLVRVAFRRANVEHIFRVCKSELGFGHFEGRRYEALLRHMNLCLVALGFVAEHTERLRGEKPGDNDGAGVPGRGGGDPELAAGPAAKQSGRMRATIIDHHQTRTVHEHLSRSGRS